MMLIDIVYTCIYVDVQVYIMPDDVLVYNVYSNYIYIYIYRDNIQVCIYIYISLGTGMIDRPESSYLYLGSDWNCDFASGCGAMWPA